MSNPDIIEIKTENLNQILPLVHRLNPNTSWDTLQNRLINMQKNQYRCIGAYINNELVGIAGFWLGYRFWCGKYMDIDNVYVDENQRNKGLGALLMQYLENLADSEQCEIIVLDSYVSNSKSHKFYFSQGYDIIGYHFKKKFKAN